MRKPTKKSILRNLDKEWKDKVKKRDDYTCQICKKKLIGINCQAHHILPKQIKEFRHDIDNGITLCFFHHKVGAYSPHMNAVWFALWLERYKYPQFLKIRNKICDYNGFFDHNQG